MRQNVHLKLTLKFTIITGIVLITTMSLFAYLNINSLQELCLQEAIKDADNLGETIIRTTHYQMLENDSARVYQMIKEVGEQDGIENIRLLNKDGIINFSTAKAEIGTQVDNNAEGCNGCHFNAIPLINAPSAARARIFTNTEGMKILGVTTEINNKPSCYTASCHFHSKDSSLLGVLDVHVSLEEMNSQIAATRNKIVFFTFAMLIVISICLALLIQKLINQPVNNLLDHSKKLAHGEMNSRISDISSDELGDLAYAFNNMAQDIERSQEELKDWGTNLESRVEERTCEIKQMQNKLMQSDKLASMGELVAGIAHEINNPLAGILLFSSIVFKDPQLNKSSKENLLTIIAETHRCSKIVRNLLEFSRESIPDKRSASTNKIINQTLAIISNLDFYQDIRIIKKFTEHLPEIDVDFGQIEQVFMNIMINAGHAMPDGGILTIRTKSIENNVVIELEDTGFGIDTKILDKIFDPFFTTKGRKKGTGLGLSISYGIIKNHDGRIEVQSVLGEGTTFTIYIPVHSELS